MTEQDKVKKTKLKLALMKDLRIELAEIFDSVGLQVQSLRARLRREVQGDEDEPICLRHDLSQYLGTLGTQDREAFQ